MPGVITYSPDHPITKDFGKWTYHPFLRPLEAIPGAPAGLNVQWLGKTSKFSWRVTDPKVLASGRIRVDRDAPGEPQIAFLAVEGKAPDAKGSKATRNTRLVVFGSGGFAANRFRVYGANLDLFVNSVSWALEDESVIAIRPREEAAAHMDLTAKQGMLIGLFTVIVIPLLVAAAGLAVWIYRRRL
jgi:hypothetical protein